VVLVGWRASEARSRLVRLVRQVPGLERTIVGLSPVHRGRRAGAKATAEAIARAHVRLPLPTWSLNTTCHPTGGQAIGWAILDAERGNADLTVLVDGRPAQQVEFGIDRPDAPRLIADGDVNPVGLTFVIPEPQLAGATWNEPIELSIGPNGVAIDRLAYFYPGDSGIIPPAENRIRVSGNDDVDAYLTEGYTAFKALRQAFARHTGRSLTSSGVVLDWGIGCGRFARYFEPHIGPRLGLLGADVDGVNVDWCTQHMPWASVTRVDGDPPMPFESGSIDVVVGISVFTHLRPELEQPWLTELRRILRPGGYALLTTLGDANFARSGLDSDTYRDLLRNGVLDVGYNNGIPGAVVGDDDYYRNCFHSATHVATTWSEHLAIVATEPALVGNHQDLWILRKTS
jgi:SAM-dependent methyltransferase